MKNAVIVPVYNEHYRAVDTIDTILEADKESLVIVVDDGSNDESFGLIKSSFDKNTRVVVLKHIINLGKGAAMKTGVEMAWKMKCKTVVFMDSDGQHDPFFLNDFKKKLMGSGLVFGYRQMDKRMPLIRKWGNVFARELVRFLFGIKRKDLLCGYMAMSKEMYEKIAWDSSRYAVETEIATIVGKKKLNFEEVKISTIYHDNNKGVSIIDAIRILLQIPFWYIRS